MRHAGTAATLQARLPADEAAIADLPDVSAWLGRSGQVLTSPALRCRVPGAAVEPSLGAWDLGTWTGLMLADVPDLPGWRADPTFDGHGGESLLAVHERVCGLLDRWHGRSGRLVAVTHAAVIRAAVLSALHAPAGSAWDLDIGPGSVTELHSTPTGWRVVRVNARG
ncbi:MAG: histidine phosphatase family protein [Frankiales bacterium]|nr:histidine phosphatase family protein [Frankiales bacterium]